MNAARRLFIDVSYTRTQTGNVGITRTVRRMTDALRALEAEASLSCAPVSFHTSGFRLSPAAAIAGPSSAKPGSPARLFRWLSSGRIRTALSLCVPLPWLHAAWALTTRATFDGVSAGEAPVEFRAGDWLILADESWNYRAWLAAEKARQRGVKVVLVLYDLIPLRQPQFCAPLFTRVFYGWLRQMLKHSDAIMCISAATEKDLHAYAKEHVLALPGTGHFRLGSDVPVANSAPVRNVVQAFLSADGPCFAAIGTIEPRKNYSMLLTVFERLWTRGVDARLLLAGRPHPDCELLVERMMVHPEQGRRLLTLLDASDSEINLAYSECSALLFPSLAEGFGLPLVEARARGCTVIASALPALLELKDEGVHFFKPDSADELEALILDQASAPVRHRPQPPRTVTWRESATQFLAEVRRLASAPVGMAEEAAAVRN